MKRSIQQHTEEETKVIGVRVPADIYKALRFIAVEKNTNLSHLLKAEAERMAKSHFGYSK